MKCYRVFWFRGIQYRALFYGNVLRTVCRRIGVYHKWTALTRNVALSTWDAFSSTQVTA